MIEEEGKHYLYRHIRLDKNEVFYVGIGTKIKKNNFETHTNEFKRAFSKDNRNRHWHGIVNKYGYKVEIVLESNNYEFIKEKEIEFIKLYGRRDLKKGTLSNFTDGADNQPNNNKTIYQYSKEDIFIKEWESATIAGSELDLNRHVISATCRKNSGGRAWSYGNFIWRLESPENKVPIIPVILNLRSENSPHSKPIYQYESSGKFIRRWSCGADVERELKVSQSHITDARLTGKTSQGCKWLSEYKGDFIEPFPKNKWEEKKLKKNDC